MTDFPTHQRPELVSQAALDNLFADAQKWRDLVTEITGRGHEHLTTVEAIADHFPNFQAIAAMSNALHADTDQNTAPTLQGPPDPFLDAFLTPSGAEPTQTPREPILSLPEMEIQTIARLNSIFGPVIVGYTNDDQLAFAFEDLHMVHTIPLHVLLGDLVRHMISTQGFAPNTTHNRQPKPPARNTRLM